MSAQHQPPTEDAKVAPRATETEAIGIEERIEQVLIEHTYVAGDNNVPAECTSAACLWKGWFLGDWRRHVASVLVAELGLREIRSTGTLIDGFLCMRYDGSASPHRHYTTPWEPA